MLPHEPRNFDTDAESQEERVRLLKRLFELFEGNDPEEGDPQAEVGG
jgi:hypothetical protein